MEEVSDIGFVPIAAEFGGPFGSAAGGGSSDAVAGSRGEAGDWGYLVREAEIVEDVGCVAVEVVVFELEVVRLGVSWRRCRRVGAEAVGGS